ncbi:MAG: hypothetical protein QOE60_2068 [Thermoleophilaceae bacterium]|jgi:hypothetical protein|nr:hypothetical protein [Thermoleophilaceae bacterium]
MAIRVFARRNFKGEDIAGFDVGNLQHLSDPMRPTSARLTASDDRLLFFLRPEWQGQAMFLHGVKEVSNLGHPGDGGRVGFENTINAMRVTPFRVQARFFVITDAGGAFPGGIASQADAETFVEESVLRADAIWAPHLVNVSLESIEFPPDAADFFDLNREFWKVILASRRFDGLRAGVNVLLVNSLRGNIVGTSVNHKLSRRVAIEPEATSFLSGHTLAHELGHFFGLGLHSDTPGNLMESGALGVDLTDGQIERAHENLARGSGLNSGIRIE